MSLQRLRLSGLDILSRNVDTYVGVLWEIDSAKDEDIRKISKVTDTA